MKTVVIDRKDVTLNFDGQSVRFDQMCIPFKHIDLLVLNHRITLQTADILRLTKAEISLLFISHANDHLHQSIALTPRECLKLSTHCELFFIDHHGNITGTIKAHA